MVWLLLFVWKTGVTYLLKKQSFVFIPNFLMFVGFALVFYSFLLYLLPYYFAKRLYFHFSLGVFVFAIAYLGFDYLCEAIIEPLIYPTKFSAPLWLFIIVISSYFFIIGFIATLYFKAKQTALVEKKLIEQKAQHEQEKLLLENAILRNRINPHLMFNTLNTLYAKAVKTQSPDMARCIMLLGDVMRYAVREEGADGKVPLQDELDHIQRLTDIQQYRFNGQFFISYRQQGDTSAARLPPQLLITLVENAFKHGVAWNAATPIEVEVHTSKDQIRFSLHNKKEQGSPMPGGGVGMDFLEKRLKLMYGGNYSLDLQDNPTDYTIHLTIPA